MNKAMKNRSWPAIAQEVIIAARLDSQMGMSWRQLSSKHGVSIGRLRRLCADVHVDNRRLISPETKYLLRRLKAEGLSAEEVASRVGFSKHSIHRLCRDLKKPLCVIGHKFLSSGGYLKIYLGKDHHLTDHNGYALEHRHVAEMKIGRRLELGEIVHHIDEKKDNNAPENLMVLPSRAHHCEIHGVSQKRQGTKSNYKVLCECGCGTAIDAYVRRRFRRRVHGHYMDWVHEEKVRRLFQMRDNGVVWNVIAEELGLAIKTAAAIYNGKATCATIPEDLLDKIKMRKVSAS
jgi:AraC-like DNA-binding protein